MKIPSKSCKMLQLTIRGRKDSSPSSSNSDSDKLQVPEGSSKSSSSCGSSCSVSVVSTTSGSSSPLIQAEEEFEVMKVLNEGSFSNSRVLLASLKREDVGAKVVVKSRDTSTCSTEEFNREVELTYLLSPHPNIVTCYNVTFHWNGSYAFLEEYAGYGSLLRVLQRRRQRKGSLSLGEHRTKLVCSQVASALEFMHGLRLVHGQIRPDNILVFKGNLSLVKLADFSASRSQGSLVSVKATNKEKRPAAFEAFVPPELTDLLPQEKYHMSPETDIWQLGILSFYLLQGKGPWSLADPLMDHGYRHYCSWLKRKALKMPDVLRPFTYRFIRLFKRLCEPKAAQRSSVRELRKYLKDPWLIRKASSEASIVRRTSNASTELTAVDGHENDEKGQCEIDNLPIPMKKLSLRNEEVDKERELREWMKKSAE